MHILCSMQSLPSGRRGRIDVNGVSLIDLKAEIARRQSEVKARATTVPNVTGAVLKRDGDGSCVSVLLRRPSSPLQKLKAKEAIDGAKGVAEEEDIDWERARRKLEAKARLYEALKQAAVTHSKEGDDDDDRAPLVDFERKAVEEERCITDSSDEDACEDRSGFRKGLWCLNLCSLFDGVKLCATYPSHSQSFYTRCARLCFDT